MDIPVFTLEELESLHNQPHKNRTKIQDPKRVPVAETGFSGSEVISIGPQQFTLAALLDFTSNKVPAYLNANLFVMPKVMSVDNGTSVLDINVEEMLLLQVRCALLGINYRNWDRVEELFLLNDVVYFAEVYFPESSG